MNHLDRIRRNHEPPNPLELDVWAVSTQCAETLNLINEVFLLREALRANVMDRRNRAGGCCDWSCDLCAPLAARS